MNRRRLEHTARMVLPFVKPEMLDMWMFRVECFGPTCAFGHECRSHKRAAATDKGFDFLDEVRTYYGIDNETGRWIFTAPTYGPHPLPAEVASRIESLLASESP